VSTYFPVVFETETTGAVSAFVPGLPVYAAADTRRQAERAIRSLLDAYLADHPEASPTAQVAALRVVQTARRRRRKLSMVGVGALVGRISSPAKIAASRLNGRLGGRPRKRARAR
jgi:hypothetical protein